MRILTPICLVLFALASACTHIALAEPSTASIAPLNQEQLLRRAEQQDISAMLTLAKAYADKDKAKALGIEQDYTQSKQWYFKAAQLGNAEAQYQVADYHADYTFGLQEPWYLKAALQGHLDSQLVLGRAYQYEDDDFINDALYWLPKASAQGSIEAEYELAKVYFKKNDCPKTIEHLTQAQTLTKAKIALFLIYHHGECGKPSVVQAQYWLKSIALDEDIYEQMARCYQNDGCDFFDTEDSAKALIWLRKAAEMGSGDAQYALGEAYFQEPLDTYPELKTFGLKQDKTEALKWFTQAAQSDHEKAQLRLYLLYSEGDGVEQSPNEAAKWLDKLVQAKAESIKPLALAERYLKGEGVKQNNATALKLLQADANPDPEGEIALKLYGLYQYGDASIRDNTQAQQWLERYLKADSSGKRHYELANKYDYDYGDFPENKTEGQRWTIQAAQLGYPDARLAVAELPIEDKTVAPAQLLEWLTAIATQAETKDRAQYQQTKAQFAIGEGYYNGRWGKVDKALALDWYHKVAAKDHSEALVRLFFMYAEGDGIPVDMAAAEALLKNRDKDDDYVLSAYHIARYYTDNEPPYFQGFAAPNPAKAKEWYKKAIAQGSRRALDSFDAEKIDSSEYLQALAKYVEPGNRDAYTTLYLSYRYGLDVPIDNAQAEHWLSEINKQIEPQRAKIYFQLAAQYQNYVEQSKLPPDLPTRIAWYRQAAELGSSRAYETLSELYLKDEGLPNHLSEAFKWTLALAQQGNKEAMAKVYIMYQQGVGTAADPAQAAAWLDNIERKKAYKELADLYQYNFLETDSTLAIPWYLKVLAEQNLGQSPTEMVMADLASIYYDDQQYAEALTWYQRLAAPPYQDSTAVVQLGIMYVNGKGVERDYAQAFNWFKQAAEDKDDNSSAAIYLYILYQHGLGVDKDSALAETWLAKAEAESGDYWNVANALGDIYYEGDMLDKDYALALEWYRKSAAQNHTEANYNLGKMYQDGQGTAVDKQKALASYLIAAQNEHTEAQVKVADLYYNGDLGQADYFKAIEWYMKAAKEGNQYAQYSVAWMYQQGQGIEPNKGESLTWFTKAAENGYLDAHYQLVELLDENRNREAVIYWLRRIVAKEDNAQKKAQAAIRLQRLESVNG